MFVTFIDCAMALIPYVYLGRYVYWGLTSFVVRSLFFSFTFGTMAPKSKKRKPDDAALEGQGPPPAPVNATIWKDMLEPAIQYIRDLHQFAD